MYSKKENRREIFMKMRDKHRMHNISHSYDLPSYGEKGYLKQNVIRGVGRQYPSTLLNSTLSRFQ